VSQPELYELARGLWAWRQPHPSWTPDEEWDPPVNSFLLVDGETALLIDALVVEPWPWLDETLAGKEVHVVQLKPDHDRSRDELAARYGARVWKPGDYFPGNELPTGALALHDGRFRGETPLWLPAHRRIVFADAAMADREGKLRIWRSWWHEEYALPAFRRMLELPVERVLVSHGWPIEHPRTELAAALERETYPGEDD
jgi:hypothetical protein